MIYIIEKDQLHKIEQVQETGLFFIDKSDFIHFKNLPEYQDMESELESPLIRFENHIDYDIIVLPTTIHTQKVKERIWVYIGKQRSFFIGSKKHFSSFILHISLDSGPSVANVLQKQYRQLSDEFYANIEIIENQALQLEDRVIKNPTVKTTSEEILHFRKLLLKMKRDFNALLDVLDSLMENEDKLFTIDDGKRFEIEKSRLERNYNHVLALLEYITEIREAYQSAVDNHLNDIMKLFTIISVIFLPLTLLVGWYGMNLQMPELEWVYSYPVVIVISILMVVFCIYYFKKNKWF